MILMQYQKKKKKKNTQNRKKGRDFFRQGLVCPYIF